MSKQRPGKKSSGGALDLSGDGGVLKTVLVEGTGETATSGKSAKVHYVGTLANGDKFDSSRDRNSPFEFNLGEGKVIKAWEIGLQSMRVGEKARLECKPKYAYGSQAVGDKIPANSTLIFEIELLGIGERKNRIIVRSLLQQKYSSACMVRDQSEMVCIR
eukprot:Nk52_evm26s211 gene=Nk52_evmTU26s211